MSEETIEAPAFATFETLTAEDVAEDVHEVVLSDGTKVAVRGLSRYEITLHGRGTEDSDVIEARNLAACIVQPQLTYGQVVAWQKRARAGGDVARVSRKIRDLSGLGPGADKSEL